MAWCGASSIGRGGHGAGWLKTRDKRGSGGESRYRWAQGNNDNGQQTVAATRGGDTWGQLLHQMSGNGGSGRGRHEAMLAAADAVDERQLRQQTR